MKKGFFKWVFLSLILVILWTECNNYKLTQNITGKKSLEILLSSIPIISFSNRSIESLHLNHYFKDVTVYLKYADEKIHTYVWRAEEIAAKKKLLQGVGIPSFIYVAVNGDQLANAQFANQTELTAAYHTITIESQNAPITILSNDVNGNPAGSYSSSQTTHLSGTTSYTIPHPTLDNTRQALVQLASSIARFELGTLKAADPTKLTSVTVDAVYVDNYYTTANKDTLVQLYENKPANSHWSKITGNNVLVTSNPDTMCYAFQLFPDIVPNFIYEISGTLAPGMSLENGETGNFANKYITITGLTQLKGIIQQNQIYKIGLTNGGIQINIEDIDASPNMNSLVTIVTIYGESTITPSI